MESFTPSHAIIPTPISAPEKQILAKPVAEQRGHTSYLTFAVLLPTVYPGSSSGSTGGSGSIQSPAHVEDATMNVNPQSETITQTG